MVTKKNKSSGLQSPKLVKTDFSGNIINRANLNNIVPSNTMLKHDDKLYLFDFDTSTIKLYDLKGF